MSQTLSVVYIGPKPQKRDTVTGSRLIFPRHQPVEVDSAIAWQLLAYPTVFARETELAAVIAREEEDARLKAREEEAEKAANREREEQETFVVMVGGEETDISKFTSVKLETLTEAEDLGLKREPSEKVDAFRIRVRDALKSRVTSSDVPTT